MTRPIGLTGGLRWMSAVAGAATLASCLTIMAAAQHGQLPSLNPATGSLSPAPGGSAQPSWSCSCRQAGSTGTVATTTSSWSTSSWSTYFDHSSSVG